LPSHLPNSFGDCLPVLLGLMPLLKFVAIVGDVFQRLANTSVAAAALYACMELAKLAGRRRGSSTNIAHSKLGPPLHVFYDDYFAEDRERGRSRRNCNKVCLEGAVSGY
jgi:hypothetical protein